MALMHCGHLAELHKSTSPVVPSRCFNCPWRETKAACHNSCIFPPLPIKCPESCSPFPFLYIFSVESLSALNTQLDLCLCPCTLVMCILVLRIPFPLVHVVSSAEVLTSLLRSGLWTHDCHFLWPMIEAYFFIRLLTFQVRRSLLDKCYSECFHVYFNAFC